MRFRETIRPSEVRRILGVSRPTFDKWVKEGIITVAIRLPASPNNPMGERRFYLEDILSLKKELRPSPK